LPKTEPTQAIRMSTWDWGGGKRSSCGWSSLAHLQT